jgi:acetylornithine deacetylase/succinyl-diaminopimelate desuccinylase-like protein
MLHLPVIASEPHPQGSPALARVRDYLVQELSASGLEVEVQRAGTLQNVVARLHGTDPTGAIVILAHYDTVSFSPGAGDNSSTVATLVEIMRALAAGPVPRNDVIALFDDGEEPGSFAGTQAFIRRHPWMGSVRVAISIDSAIAGFISMNEVGPKNNGWLVHALARAYTGGNWMS